MRMQVLVLDQSLNMVLPSGLRGKLMRKPGVVLSDSGRLTSICSLQWAPHSRILAFVMYMKKVALVIVVGLVWATAAWALVEVGSTTGQAAGSEIVLRRIKSNVSSGFLS